MGCDLILQYLRFIKLYICFCALGAFILFVGVEFSFPLDLLSYVSLKANHSLLETKLWLQGVSLVFLWFAGLFGLLLLAKTPTRAENTKIRS